MHPLEDSLQKAALKYKYVTAEIVCKDGEMGSGGPRVHLWFFQDTNPVETWAPLRVGWGWGPGRVRHTDGGSDPSLLPSIAKHVVGLL